MTEPVLVPGLVALVDPVTGRFSDSLAPPSVAANTAAAAAAASQSASAKTAAEAAQAAAVAAKVAAETAAATVIAVNADAVTVDNLGQATTLGKTLAKLPDAATGRATLSAVGKGDLVIDVRDAPYSADPTGTADATTAITAALAAGITAGAKVFGVGTFKISSTITITGPCDFTDATFNFTGTTGVAIQLGNPASSLHRTTMRLPRLIATAKTVLGWAQVAGTVGVKVTNLYTCDVYIPLVRSFETGLLGHGNTPNGTSYVNFYMGHLDNNKVNFQAAPQSSGSGSTSGWFTQNIFFGGRFSHNSAEGARATGTRHVLISASTWPVDNLTFIGSSLEGVVPEYIIDSAGTASQWINCRYENPVLANTRVIWRTGSAGNRIVGGVASERITQETEALAYNPGTTTPLVTFNQSNAAGLPPSLGVGGLAADALISHPIWSPDGVASKVVALHDSGFTGVGAPEGAVTAQPGAIYTRLDAGTRTNLCTRPISSTVAATTGWGGLGGTLTAGSGFLRNTLNADATGSASRTIGAANTSTYAVTGSTEYVFSAQARTSASLPVFLTLTFYTAGLVRTGPTLYVGRSTPTNPTTFVDVSPLSVTSPSDAAFVAFQVRIDTGTNANGDTLDVRQFMYERGSIAGVYFDGTTTLTGATCSWTGTANASTSTASFTTTAVSYVKTGSGNTGWKQLITTVPGGVDLAVFTSSGTWTKPLGCTSVQVIVVGGGSGGGSGRRGAAGTVRCGGGGGAGGAVSTRTLPASVCGATETVSVGAGGNGGASIAVNDTDGAAGSIGGLSGFGSHVTITQPSGGGGGTATAGTAGLGGSGSFVGGAGGAASATGFTGSNAATSSGGASGGGGGGGISAANGASAGGNGAFVASSARTQSVGAAADTSATSSPAAPANSGEPGQGGGGGGASITGAGGVGAAGAIYGGGGGGGGASLNGNNSGAGGAGAAGIVVVIST